MERIPLKVHHLLGANEPIEGDIGIEIEVEARTVLPTIQSKVWEAKREGSLRGAEEGRALEYVTRGPIACDNKKRDKIEYICRKLGAPDIGVDENSIRTSVHVHCNVQGHTLPEVYTTATAYWLLENLLFKYCGPETREGNLFCLRLKDAESVLDDIKKDIDAQKFFQMFTSDSLKYSGQNLACLNQFGTLEYRGMRGTINAEIIDTWTDILYRMVVGSKAFGTPEKLMDSVYRYGVETVLNMLVPNHVQMLKSLSKDWKDLLEENILSLCDIAYSVNWEHWEKKVEEKYWGKTTRSRKPKRTIDVLARARGDGIPPEPPQDIQDPWQAAAVNIVIDDMQQLAQVNANQDPMFWFNQPIPRHPR